MNHKKFLIFSQIFAIFESLFRDFEFSNARNVTETALRKWRNTTCSIVHAFSPSLARMYFQRPTLISSFQGQGVKNLRFKQKRSRNENQMAITLFFRKKKKTFLHRVSGTKINESVFQTRLVGSYFYIFYSFTHLLNVPKRGKNNKAL